MDRERKPTGLLVPVVAIVFVLLLAAYGAGYLLLSRDSNTWLAVDGRWKVVREYRYEWMVAIFRPGTVVEGWVTGADVDLGSSAELNPDPVPRSG